MLALRLVRSETTVRVESYVTSFVFSSKRRDGGDDHIDESGIAIGQLW